MLILLLIYSLISNALSLRKDKSTFFSRIVMVISSLFISNAFFLRKDKLFSSIAMVLSNLFKNPASPGKNMKAIHSAANPYFILAVGGISIIYRGDIFYTELLYNISGGFNSFTDLLGNLSSFNSTAIHISDIPLYEIKSLKINALTCTVTPFYNGVDILNNIGNRSYLTYNYLTIFIVPIPYLMPYIGYVAYRCITLDYIITICKRVSKSLLNFFKKFNKWLGKESLFNKFNILKNTTISPIFRKTRVYMEGVSTSVQTGNNPKKDKDNDEDKKKDDDFFKLWYNSYRSKETSYLNKEYRKVSALMRYNLTRIENTIQELIAYLQRNNTSYILNPNHSLTTEVPAHLSELETEAIRSDIENIGHRLQGLIDDTSLLHRRAQILEDRLSQRSYNFHTSSQFLERLNALLIRYGNIINQANNLN